MFQRSKFLIHLISLFFFYDNIAILNAKGPDLVTCGSVLKLFNTDYNVRLHSHDVKYGSGSGQQSVTGVPLPEDINSHWVIRGLTGSNCDRGEEIKCGEVIRLQHLTTKKNLHSHLFSSPLSHNQEISCYGASDGEGDTGDHWRVVCDSQIWYRSRSIKLQHVDTGSFLAASSQSYGRPISGQQEIIGVRGADVRGTDWKPMEGLFIHKNELNIQQAHDEL